MDRLLAFDPPPNETPSHGLRRPWTSNYPKVVNCVAASPKGPRYFDLYLNRVASLISV